MNIPEIQDSADADAKRASESVTIIEKNPITYLRWLINSLGPIVQFILHPADRFEVLDAATLKADVIAALTVAVITVPQAMAYALIAELPPEAGLYAAIVGLIVGALWGSSRHLQTGPTNTVSLLVLSVLLTVASPNDAHYLFIAGALALLVGLIQVMLALARLGVSVNFISEAVIIGFTGGAGILIAFNQLRNLLRLDIPSMPHLWETIPEILAHLPDTHVTSS